MKHLMIATLFLTFLPLTASADEAALYAPTPPADSAFVRVINASTSDDLNITLSGSEPVASEEARVSSYSVLKEGAHTLALGDAENTLDLEAGNYYTVAITADGTHKVIKDIFVEDPTKAALHFYNFSTETVSLTSPSYGATIFENIESNDGTARDINAVTFDLAITNTDGDVVQELPEVSLKRRQGTSIVVIDNDTVITLDNNVEM